MNYFISIARPVLGMLVFLVDPLAGCTTNPATGRSQLNLLSRAEEIEIGVSAAPELEAQYGGRAPDESLQSYVRRVGMSMVQHVEADYGELPWDFRLLDSDVINAFALPGGKVYITRGLAEQLGDEAQLAGILGHEIGHVTAEHADKRVTSQVGFELLAAGVGLATTGAESQLIREAVPVLVGVGGQGFLLKFGRDEELEADELGMRYMSKAGYDPAAQLDVMRILAGASEGPRPPEWASTHPHPETRINAIQSKLNGKYQGVGGQRYEGRYRSEFLSGFAMMTTPWSQLAAAP